LAKDREGELFNVIFNPSNLKGGKNKKTREQVQKEISQKNPKIKILSEYNGGNNFADFGCGICKHKWREKVNYVIRKGSCPNCGDTQYKRTREEMTEELLRDNEHNSGVEITDRTNEDGSRVQCKCRNCGDRWYHPLSQKLSQIGCFKCANASRRKTNESYVQDLSEKNPKIKMITEYSDGITPIKVKCLEDGCGCEWDVMPSSLIYKDEKRRTGCPSCNQSKGEKKIEEFMKEEKVNYSPQHTFEHCRNAVPLRFDFYIEEMNLCIEYDGEHHFRPVYYSKYKTNTAVEQFEYRQNNDRIKNEYCGQEKILLLRIPYWEFKNIEEILKRVLREEDLVGTIEELNEEMNSKEKKTA
jgi:very-short-patch-repair endonuclease